MLSYIPVLALAAQASAHYTFPSIAGTSDWAAVRQWTGYQSNGPVTDVSLLDIRCNVGASTKSAAQIQTIPAGGKITFAAAPDIYHPGPLMAYMAKVPAGKTAANWDGSGNVWFKVFELGPKFGSALTWPSDGMILPNLYPSTCPLYTPNPIY
jgi:hypothetical protein